jgi:hypothetical protein
MAAVLASGMVLDIVITGTPAGTHVAGWAHNWKKHRPEVLSARSLAFSSDSWGGA